MPEVVRKRFKPRDEPTAVPLPATFVPKFWQDQDHRCVAVKRVREMVEALTSDAGVDSAQKALLAQRAAFLALRLETMEVAYATEGRFDAGVYTAMTNTLVGLLKALGLERKARQATLTDYLKEQA